MLLRDAGVTVHNNHIAETGQSKVTLPEPVLSLQSSKVCRYPKLQCVHLPASHAEAKSCGI